MALLVVRAAYHPVGELLKKACADRCRYCESTVTESSYESILNPSEDDKDLDDVRKEAIRLQYRRVQLTYMYVMYLVLDMITVKPLEGFCLVNALDHLEFLLTVLKMCQGSGVE